MPRAASDNNFDIEVFDAPFFDFRARSSSAPTVKSKSESEKKKVEFLSKPSHKSTTACGLILFHQIAFLLRMTRLGSSNSATTKIRCESQIESKTRSSS